MQLNEYQWRAIQTAVYKKTVRADNHLAYVMLGLAGEVGELCNKYKKIVRDSGGAVDTAAREALVKELGGILWYVAAVATELDEDLSDIAAINLEELRSRAERGTLQGSGDDR